MENGDGNFVWWVIAGLIAFVLISLTLKQRSQRSSSSRRHHFDHKKTDSHKIGLESPEDLPEGLTPRVEAEIRKSMRAGKKIGAIKIYREATGLGLKESKEAVERDFT